jgi:hypothetical protein
MDASVGAMAANVMTAAAAAADLTTELQSGLATAAALATVSTKIDTVDDLLDTEMPAVTASLAALTTAVGVVDDLLDTEVAAIKADTAAIKLKTDNLPAAPASTGDVTTVGAAVAALVAPDNAGITAIQAKTDQLAFTSGSVNANMESVNGVALTGDGSSGDKFRV